MKIGDKVLFMGTKMGFPSDYIGVVVASIKGNHVFKVVEFYEKCDFMHDATHLKLVLDDDSVYIPSESHYYAINDAVCKILGEI